MYDTMIKANGQIVLYDCQYDKPLFVQKSAKCQSVPKVNERENRRVNAVTCIQGLYRACSAQLPVCLSQPSTSRLNFRKSSLIVMVVMVVAGVAGGRDARGATAGAWLLQQSVDGFGSKR